MAIDCDERRAIVVIGSDEDDVFDTNTGNVFTYEYTYDDPDIGWVELVELFPIDYDYDAAFGSAVAIDDNKLIIGSDGKDLYSGGVYFTDISRKSIEEGIKVSIEYNYLTKLEIAGIDDDNNNVSFIVDECEIETSSAYTNFDSGSLDFSVNAMNGCFEIVFSDCDDSVINEKTNSHGYYDIKVNETIFAYGGYYYSTENHLVCTNETNQVEFCITPEYCANNNNLEIDVRMDGTTVELSSYRSLTYSFLDGESLQDGGNYADFLCSGDQSCIYSTIQVMCIVHCVF